MYALFSKCITILSQLIETSKNVSEFCPDNVSVHKCVYRFLKKH